MKYKIILDKQSRTNPSNEKKEYEIDIEELRTRRNVYDSIVITREEAYVLRKLVLSDLQVLSELPEPIKEPLNNLKIELFEGDNYIYLVDMIGNKFYAEYLIKNDFTDMYATKNEMNAAISNTAQSIELSVNQKLTSYATNEELENKVTELNGTIEAKAGEINLEVSKKVNNEDLTGANIALRLNNDTSEAQINADKINLNGAISANGNFKIDTNGNMACNNATFNGGKIDLISNSSNPAFNVKGNDNSSGYFSSRDISISEFSNSGIPAQASLSIYESGVPTLDLVGRNLTSSTMVSSSGIETPTITQTSLKSKKKNIKKLNVNAIDLIKNSDICLYNLKGEKAKTKKHIGLVIGEGYNCPDEVISEDKQGVEQYSMISLAWKAIQELIQENNKLKQRIEKLEVQNGKN